MFELNRDQNDCRLISYNATTGEKTAELYRETSEKYVEPLHPILFLALGRGEIYHAEPEGRV